VVTPPTLAALRNPGEVADRYPGVDLLCPKCHNLMRGYERNGVLVDQCTECKGLFLDRGELEKLVAAERSYYRPDPAYAPPRPDSRDDDRRHDDGDRHDDGRRGRKRRRGSFLGDLLDFD
jgi:Zn-finger nucleic acid-binding protein